MSQNQLVGKVVLLVGNDTAFLPKLVTQLAQKGADIALLCWQMPREMARKIKESVQAYGQKILLIDPAEQEGLTSKQLIDTVTMELGHLDVLIDLSAQSRLTLQKEDPNGMVYPVGFSQPNWQLNHVVLEKLTR